MLFLAKFVNNLFRGFALAWLRIFLIHGCVEALTSNLVRKKVDAGSSCQIAQVNARHGFKTDCRRNTPHTLNLS
jgi:hypothetical protein